MSEDVLVELLKEVEDWDEDFILAIKVHTKEKSKRDRMIEYLKNTKTVSYEEALLYSLALKKDMI